jgi:DNA invertase Pin-like site-specific DNA recombinase
MDADASARARYAAQAAQYVRMSTEHQQYSIDNQVDAIAEYADQHGLQVVRTYEDSGRSGLTLKGRPGLGQLLRDVLSGTAEFGALLVYDVSRWGRFQDVDESAHYEFLCRNAGVRVIYCAEQFDNDGGPLATILKSIKRSMAGEYSRELSDRVFRGMSRLVAHGYKVGGTPGYGLRRLLLDDAGRPQRVLENGERKAITTDRVVLTGGPADEVAVVRRIFQLFAITGLRERHIASQLDSEGLRNAIGRPWHYAHIKGILTNERYIGNYVWNKRSKKLSLRSQKNPASQWVRSDGCFAPIVDPALFHRAQEIFRRRPHRMSKEQLLADLRDLYEREGRLTADLINEEPGMANTGSYRTRFGSIGRAYDLVGFEPRRRRRRPEPDFRDRCNSFLGEVAQRLRDRRVPIRLLSANGLRVHRRVTLQVRLTRYRYPHKASHWVLDFTARHPPDFTLVCRLERNGHGVVDYYLLPATARQGGRRYLALDDRAYEPYRLKTLDDCCDRLVLATKGAFGSSLAMTARV